MKRKVKVNNNKEQKTRDNFSNNVVHNANRLQPNTQPVHGTHTIHGINITTIINYLPISKKLIFILLILV